MTKKSTKIALWSVHLAHRVKSMADWLKMVDAQAAAAAKKGAGILVMPEYSAEQWFCFAPKEALAVTRQLGWLADQVEKALTGLKKIARKNRLILIPGSFPAHAPGLVPPLNNRAHIIFPDGRVLTQNKLCLTPLEKNKAGWNLSPGDHVSVFEWQGFRCAVVICLDIEMPALAAHLAAHDLDLIIVPSMTKRLAGYHRVADCAKARAIELQAAIADVGCIASVSVRETNIGGAAVFLPCEEELGHKGLLAAIKPSYKAKGRGPMLVADVPLATIRDIRKNRAEVWPGAWSAAHVKVQEQG